MLDFAISPEAGCRWWDRHRVGVKGGRESGRELEVRSSKQWATARTS